MLVIKGIVVVMVAVIAMIDMSMAGMAGINVSGSAGVVHCLLLNKHAIDDEWMVTA